MQDTKITEMLTTSWEMIYQLFMFFICKFNSHIIHEIIQVTDLDFFFEDMESE